MLNDNIVVLKKNEYEILVMDSLLATITRNTLRDEDNSCRIEDQLRLIYRIPEKGKEVNA